MQRTSAKQSDRKLEYEEAEKKLKMNNEFKKSVAVV
jgi:hypothetical protein